MASVHPAAPAWAAAAPVCSPAKVSPSSANGGSRPPRRHSRLSERHVERPAAGPAAQNLHQHPARNLRQQTRCRADPETAGRARSILGEQRGQMGIPIEGRLEVSGRLPQPHVGQGGCRRCSETASAGRPRAGPLGTASTSRRSSSHWMSQAPPPSPDRVARTTGALAGARRPVARRPPATSFRKTPPRNTARRTIPFCSCAHPAQGT